MIVQYQVIRACNFTTSQYAKQAEREILQFSACLRARYPGGLTFAYAADILNPFKT